MTRPVKLANVNEATLGAAIPPSRRGRARVKRLRPGERSLYEWILRAFAAGAPPAADTLADAASSFDVDVEVALARLAREDLVHHDPATGAILVAYPFSGRPRGHRVLIDGKHWVEAMCAIDALGIAPMLNLPVEIKSRDPLTCAEVWAHLDPGDGTWWEPHSAVVLDGSIRRGGPGFMSCCDVINFFESGESALRYLVANPHLSAHPVTLPEAIELGRAIFGDLLEED